MSDKKITIITIISMAVSLLLITIGLSFAYFTANITGTENSTTINVTGGVMTIHYDSTGQEINAQDIRPDNNPFGTKTFTLTGTNTTSNNMEYHILLIVEENTFTDDALMYKLTSSNTDDNGVVAPSIEVLTGILTGNNQEIFLGNAHFSSPTEGNKVHTYNLEMYFPDTGVPQDEDQGKIFKGYINIIEGKYVKPPFNEEKGVNHPVLFTGMSPVVWDGEEFVETTEDDSSWYDYDEKKWANARTQDGSYWVWIPRYAYKITSGYHLSATGTIDVKFLKGRTNNPVDDTIVETEGYEPGTKDTSMHYFLHPAFQFNGDELGFWIAKFEPTAHEGLSSGITDGSCSSLDNVSTKSPKIGANEISWRCITISNAYKASLAMKNNPIYGWNKDEVDTHILTNEEWGAVTYLSKSQYGAPTEVWNNSFTGFQTGCSGPSVSAYSQATCTEYDTENGQYASTTHNIYGVYDMSGGAWERVMGNYNGYVGSSQFVLEELLEIHPKYINRYYTAPEDLLNGSGVNYDLNVYGDAVYETSHNAYRYNGSSWDGVDAGSWYSDRPYLPWLPSYPWFLRGAYWGDSATAGVFSFSDSGGNAHWSNSFRPALFPL